MKKASVLIADDDEAIRTVVARALSHDGYDVHSAANAATLWAWIEQGLGDVVVTDVVMPDENGLDLLPRIKRRRPELKVIVMSAHSTLATALKAGERGAFDYLPKPFDLDELRSLIARALEGPGDTSKKKAPDEGEALPLVGRAPAMQDIFRSLARVVATDLTVMIIGESGTGKELIARALHDYSRNRQGLFVAVNMAAIPRELIESELFGHERGAFTGADKRQIGRFEQAAGGTLLLDEIGDMPLEAQTRLLRVLQEGEFTRIGGRETVKASARIVTASHRDLGALVRRGLFREDLFFRLNVLPLRLPPLRDRKEDIPDLVHHFLKRGEDEGLPPRSIDAEALKLLSGHLWPGNVRELENMVRRLMVLTPAERIDAKTVRGELTSRNEEGRRPALDGEAALSDLVEHKLTTYFADHEGRLPPPGLHERVLREVEKPLIALTLAATGGNQIKAAAVLGLNRNTLRKKIRELDLDAGAFRK